MTDRFPTSGPSRNRVAVAGEFEFFRRGDEICRAKLADPVMTDGYRFGRFECYAHAWDSYSTHIIAACATPAPVAVEPTPEPAPRAPTFLEMIAECEREAAA